MPPYHVSSASRALHRVFIAPNLNLARRPLLPFLECSPMKPALSLTQPPIRTRSYKKDTRRYALSDTYTLDNAISAPRINFIDMDGRFHRDIATLDAQSSLNRTTEHLVLITQGRVDEHGRPDPKSLPICKAISKMDLRMQHEKKLDIERRGAKGRGAGPSAKNLELNWAIADGDLRHRLKRMQDFLREGRKVEVVLGPKRRGRVATEDECKKVLKTIRGAVNECKGAGEVKEPDGRAGGVMTLVFEGKKMDKETQNGGEKDYA